ncbi:MAG: efflux RND transporter periplasmic adaptor subunit [Betaproteobacteria bacterium]|nr:efflux RND transporter periplasmic adaptor subunit [Betaproteobacteria bacterium]
MTRQFFVRLLCLTALFPALAGAQAPATTSVTRFVGGAGTSFDGVVEAVRQTSIGAQVSGAVVAIAVKAGDPVRAGQVLLRLDARAAEQNAAAADAQVAAARATQEAARRELERQKMLFEQRFISRAALDRAEADHQTTQAVANAQIASAGAARTQSGFYVVRAPYAAVVAEVPVVLGDMALPGKTLLTLYDPGALRVSVAVPQRAAARLVKPEQLRVELPSTGLDPQVPVRVQRMPTIDAATHTQELRLDLPPGLAGLAPGMFARVSLAPNAESEARLFVPATAVVRRAEMSGVYVLGAAGKPRLRQVRLGRAEGTWIEVLAGLSEGERLIADANTALRRE